MATAAQVRADIATNLGTISGLAILSRPTDQVNEWPVAMLDLPDTIEYDVTFHGDQGGFVRYLFPLRVFVGRYDMDESTIALDAYVAPVGATSVKAAVEKAGATSGWSFCSVSEARDFGVYEVAGQDLLGVEFVVEVLAI